MNPTLRTQSLVETQSPVRIDKEETGPAISNKEGGPKQPISTQGDKFEAADLAAENARIDRSSRPPGEKLSLSTILALPFVVVFVLADNIVREIRSFDVRFSIHRR